MTHPELLVVDPDAAARGLILKGLHEAGVPAIGVRSAYDALARLDEATPSLVVAEVALPDIPGTELAERFRSSRRGAEVPFYFLTAESELDLAEAERHGAQDLIQKPAFVRDVVTLARLHAGRPATASVLDARIEDVGLPHVLRLLASGRRTGRVVVLDGEGEIRFRRGRLLAATFRDRVGEAALMRLLTLSAGSVHVVFEDVPIEGDLDMTVDDLFSRGFLHVRAWDQVTRDLYPLDTALVVDYPSLGKRLGEIPDAVNPVLRLFDGTRTIEDLVDESPMGDLTTLRVVAKLDRMGVLSPAPTGTVAEPAEGVEAPVAEEAAPAPTPTDRLLEGLFGGTGLPDGAGAVAAHVPVLTDWYEGEPKPSSWNEILPEATDSQVGHATAPDMEGLGETPVDRPREERAEAPPAPAAEEAFEEHVEAFFTEEVGKREGLSPATRGFPWFPAILVVAALAAVAIALTFVSARAPAHKTTTPHAAPAAASLTMPALHVTGPAAAATVMPAPAAVKPAPVAAKPAPVAAKPAPAAAKPAPVAVKPAPAAPNLETLLASGQKAYAAGHLKEAVGLYGKAVHLAPKSAVAYLGLGLAQLDSDQNAKAITSLEKARTLDPSSARAAVLLGTAYQLAGNKDEAARAYHDYLKLAPHGEQAGDVGNILASWGK